MVSPVWTTIGRMVKVLIGPQEYTGIKMEVLEWSPLAKEVIERNVGGHKVFLKLVAATLRSETMYGQTHCFVGTAIKYGMLAINDRGAFVCTYRSARNMAFQGTSTPRGEVQQLLELTGDKIVGTKINAPFTLNNPKVYVLPMDNVLATKGTGVVTSVPSDSPDDCATLYDIRKKAAFYKVDPSWATKKVYGGVRGRLELDATCANNGNDSVYS